MCIRQHSWDQTLLDHTGNETCPICHPMKTVSPRIPPDDPEEVKKAIEEIKARMRETVQEALNRGGFRVPYTDDGLGIAGIKVGQVTPDMKANRELPDFEFTATLWPSYKEEPLTFPEVIEDILDACAPCLEAEKQVDAIVGPKDKKLAQLVREYYAKAEEITTHILSRRSG